MRTTAAWTPMPVRVVDRVGEALQRDVAGERDRDAADRQRAGARHHRRVASGDVELDAVTCARASSLTTMSYSPASAPTPAETLTAVASLEVAAIVETESESPSRSDAVRSAWTLARERVECRDLGLQPGLPALQRGERLARLLHDGVQYRG